MFYIRTNVEMSFIKKKLESPLSRTYLRRRFHNFLIAKRKSPHERQLSKTMLDRPRRNIFRPIRSAHFIVFQKIAIGSALVGTVLAGIYLVFFSSFFAIAKIDLEKNGDSVSYTQLTPFVENIRGKNLLFVNEKLVAGTIQKAFPNEILLVKISKTGLI